MNWKRATGLSRQPQHGLKKRIDPEERELRQVHAKLGEVMMRLELVEV